MSQDAEPCSCCAGVSSVTGVLPFPSLQQPLQDWYTWNSDQPSFGLQQSSGKSECHQIQGLTHQAQTSATGYIVQELQRDHWASYIYVMPVQSNS